MAKTFNASSALYNDPYYRNMTPEEYRMYVNYMQQQYMNQYDPHANRPKVTVEEAQIRSITRILSGENK